MVPNRWPPEPRQHYSWSSLKRTNTNLAEKQLLRARLAALGFHCICWDNVQIIFSVHATQREQGPTKFIKGTQVVLYVREGNPLNLAECLPDILARRATGETLSKFFGSP
ncbi:hypothetical protein CONPUDRAFT_160700 [Coniophora puteana RWD-64-598 SS2]|uniref:Uncharacterized protein n=1 Tax=Coniophora puteana (strain RWD-64-598) TaxID=741705 RepID=R7SCA3_CONPW|nr:uncharacterized protein CONPUDRAFT_160700 [Coniophora puteana RWD-64-598 SS2]EIW73801.1 hypothetical protein CONPUDRAFT_160700 [Coniophora puteana RWD-64-598 SS2]